MDIQYLLRLGHFAVAWAINDLIIIMESVQVKQEELGAEAVQVTAKLPQALLQVALGALVL